ncbi:paired amphipathic helix protein Sin3-like 2 [Hibiscus syriacus]|uniref:paired amphipathic helix protein Sin3-like 2 n=1 Tax=Hibiscus syriacus TaxID=106335 RepID=UPI0019229942|nr:paired amphipathic helix protein Sin3-like 2 [Hibiscus syriacus]
MLDTYPYPILTPKSDSCMLNLLLFTDICRNKKKYATLDEFAAICMAMEGVELVNGLENKIACNSYKISYVLDTEDFFFRRRKSPQSKSSYDNQARVQRFDKFLSASQ